MRAFLAVATLVVASLAGCIAPEDITANLVNGPPDAAGGAYAALAASLADLPCVAEEVGTGTSENVREVTNLAYDGSTHGEIDVHGDWLLAARNQLGGFEVVNVADPATPVLVTAWQSEEASALDVKWMPDGRHAVVGHYGTVSLVDVGPVLDSTLTPEAIRAQEIAPVLVSTYEYPGSAPFTNMHMLYTHRIGGEDYVFLAPNDDSGVWILKLTGSGADAKLDTVGRVSPPLLGGGPLGPHDMWVADDEITESPILYVANGFEGWAAFDVSDPASPALLAVMPNLGLAQQYTHSIVAQKIGERRIVVTIAEVGVNVMKVFDATDFSAPVLVAEWWGDKTKPHAPQHNLQLVNGTLFVAHYTQGVYVFDLTTLGTVPLAASLELAPVAHYAVPEPEQADVLGFGNVWDVVVHRGVVYVNDTGRGTAVVGYGCFTPGDPTLTGTG